MTAKKTTPSSRRSAANRNGHAQKNGVAAPEFPLADLEGLVTEDDAPVDSFFHGNQQDLLVEPLRSSWAGPAGDGLYIAAANVGVFTSVEEPPIVPDAFLSLGVKVASDFSQKKNRSYFVWLVGKPPEVTVEVVSNKKGGEDTDKLRRYAEMGVRYYAIFDPLHVISRESLRLYVLHRKAYKRYRESWMPEVGLGLCLWDGCYEDMDAEWLRWCDKKGMVIPTGAERSERLAAKLRELGIDPDNV